MKARTNKRANKKEVLLLFVLIISTILFKVFKQISILTNSFDQYSDIVKVFVSFQNNFQPNFLQD